MSKLIQVHILQVEDFEQITADSQGVGLLRRSAEVIPYRPDGSVQFGLENDPGALPAARELERRGVLKILSAPSAPVSKKFKSYGRKTRA